VKNIVDLLMKVLSAMTVSFLSACSTQVPMPSRHRGIDAKGELAARVDARNELRVLFVGNSYSFGAPREFAKLASKRGHRVHVDQSTFSGWTLQRHAAFEGTRQMIRNGNWDVVVFQEFSEIPALPLSRCAAQMFSPLRELVNDARNHGAISVLYQTWGHRDGAKNLLGDDFHAMTQRVRANYQAASENAGGLIVLPVGDAWEREFFEGRGRMLFLADGSHPSGAGNRLTASVFVDSLFGKP